ncbi:tyrosine-type recombinase/integrase [Citreicella sp. C3M06]|uniref:tyrosine-type recombinase/integrase n=1 Tax=Citreicella sp. C3M06 TaxID=2841564 RepID=UPI001C0A2FDE|nr:tyrosine-type recombinase/integrase [Citreicella sp. C3M06]MBU2962725.1 tyrosine-type recombinase/integrase [Citreicella sp. C3M06]
MTPPNPFPGWYSEQLPSGNTRHIVRMKGQKGKRTTVPVGPEHPDFLEHYRAARVGEKWQGEPAAPEVPRESLDGLRLRYLAHLEKMVEGGNASPSTLKQRRSLLSRLCDHLDDDGDRYGDLHLNLPQHALIRVRNARAATPAEADNMMKAAKAMYTFAIETGAMENNPAQGIAKIHKSKGGTTPWTAADMRQFAKSHPPGSMAFLWLTLAMFTGARIGDLCHLGRHHEVTRNGAVWLEWQPGKKGSAPVSMPILPPLLRTIRAMPVVGPAYLLSERGKPFKNVETLRTRVRRWCDDAGLQNRSSHGVRKGMATMLAEAGANEQQIGAVLSHTQPSTTRIYTQTAQRSVLSQQALSGISNIVWG